MCVCVCVCARARKRLVAQSCLTLCNLMDCSPPGSSVHGNSPGKNTGVGCYALLQGIFSTQGLNPGLLHCRRILCGLSHQGSPRILEWVAYPLPGRSSQPRDRTGDSCIAGKFFTSWATREAHILYIMTHKYIPNWNTHICIYENIETKTLTLTRHKALWNFQFYSILCSQHTGWDLLAENSDLNQQRRFWGYVL